MEKRNLKSYIKYKPSFLKLLITFNRHEIILSDFYTRELSTGYHNVEALGDLEKRSFSGMVGPTTWGREWVREWSQEPQTGSLEGPFLELRSKVKKRIWVIAERRSGIKRVFLKKKISFLREGKWNILYGYGNDPIGRGKLMHRRRETSRSNASERERGAANWGPGEGLALAGEWTVHPFHGM